MSDPTIDESVQRGVARLQEMPPEQWGPWLVAVLDELEPRIEANGWGDAFDAALRDVQHYLERRLLRRLGAPGDEETL